MKIPDEQHTQFLMRLNTLLAEIPSTGSEVEYELLAHYVVFMKNPLAVPGIPTLDEGELDYVRAMIVNSTAWSEAYSSLASSYEEIERSFNQRFADRKERDIVKAVTEGFQALFNWSQRPVLASVNTVLSAVLLFLIVGLATYDDPAQRYGLPLTYSAQRSVAMQSQISEVESALIEGEFASALALAELIDRTQLDSKSRMRLLLLMMDATLSDARSTIAGLFPSYDRIKLRQTLTLADEASTVVLELQDSMRDQLLEHVLFETAAAQILAEDWVEAHASLQKIVDINGAKRMKAEELLRKIPR